MRETQPIKIWAVYICAAVQKHPSNLYMYVCFPWSHMEPREML
jgi:hypothetical protein